MLAKTCNLPNIPQVGYETLNQMLGCTAAYPAKRIMRVGGPDDRCAWLCTALAAAHAAPQMCSPGIACLALQRALIMWPTIGYVVQQPGQLLAASCSWARPWHHAAMLARLLQAVAYSSC
jgi:hypothetical protein